MQRYKNFVHMEEMKQLLEAGKKEEALRVAETININKIKTMSDLSVMAEVFFQNQNYPRAKQYFEKIYARLKTRRILAQMVNLSIKLKNEEDAERYLEEFERIAPKDFYRHIFRFDIDKMIGQPYGVLIDDLERLKKEEYMDSWSYELAKLYHKTKNKEKCIKECSRIILWFGNGVYVERAMALKAYYEGELEVEGGFLKLDANAKGVIHDTLVAAQARLTAVEVDYTEQEVDHLSSVGAMLEKDVPDEPIKEKEIFVSTDLDGTETTEFEFISSSEIESGKIEFAASQAEIEETKDTQIDYVEEVHEEVHTTTVPESYYIEEKDAENDSDELQFRELIIRMPSIKSVKFGSKRKIKDYLSTDTKVFTKREQFPWYKKELSKKENMKLALNENISEVEKALAEAIRMNMQEDTKKSDIEKEPKQIVSRKFETKQKNFHLEREGAEKEVDEKIYQLLQEETFEEEDFLPVVCQEPQENSVFNKLLKEKGATIDQLFGFCASINKVRSQLIKVMEHLLNEDTAIRNLVVTGEAMCGKTTLAKNIFRVLYKANLLQSVQIARISAEKFCEIDLKARKEKMRKTILIIEHADRLKEVAARQLAFLVDELGKETIFILEAEDISMQKFFEKNQELVSIFPHYIKIPILSAEQMCKLAMLYIIEQGYEMEDGVNLLIEQQINKLKASTPNNTLRSMFTFLEGVMKKTDDRNTGKLLQLSLSGKVTEENFLLIKKEDFKQ